MQIVWDEAKRLANLAKHGLDFAHARERFVFEEALGVPAHEASDGRARYVALNVLDGRLVAVVFAPLGTEAIAPISLRSASRRERRVFEDA
jgi:uncharacterized protein